MPPAGDLDLKYSDEFTLMSIIQCQLDSLFSVVYVANYRKNELKTHLALKSSVDKL